MDDACLLPISPPRSPGDEAAWLRLWLLSGRCHRKLSERFVSPSGAIPAELLLMACAAELGEACQQSDLVDRLGCSAAHVSGALERLRQRGWMAAARPAEDRRRQCWRLTETGSAALAEVRLLPCKAGEESNWRQLLDQLTAVLPWTESEAATATSPTRGVSA